METPSVPFATWILATVDPALVIIAVVLGAKADQFGKVFIAAIAALGLSLLVAWLVTRIGLPWPAPVGRELPTLVPVRAVSAFFWALLGYGLARVVKRRT